MDETVFNASRLASCLGCAVEGNDDDDDDDGVGDDDDDDDDDDDAAAGEDADGSRVWRLDRAI